MDSFVNCTPGKSVLANLQNVTFKLFEKSMPPETPRRPKNIFLTAAQLEKFFRQESHFKLLQNVGNGFERRSHVYESLMYHSRILTCREQRLHVVIRMHTFKSPPSPPKKNPTKLEQGSHFRLVLF